MIVWKTPVTPKQMVNLLEGRLTELTGKIEGTKYIKDGQLFRTTHKNHVLDLMSLYNLNLRLLKIWNPKEPRLELRR